MSARSSRRTFLTAAGLAVPAAALGSSASSAPRYGVLGRTGLRVTKYIFGSMITSDATVIERAVDLGVNCFATARDFWEGHNERFLGAALKAKRKNLIVITESLDVEMAGRRPPESKEELVEQLNTSLRELQTDYVDLWLLHNKNSPEGITDTHLEVIQQARKHGKIRFAGVTTHRLPAIADFVVNTEELDAVMPVYNFLMDARMHATVERMHKAGLGVIAMKVMAGGLRAQNPLPQFQREGALMAAFKWALTNPNVDAAVTSTTSMEELEQDFRAMSGSFTHKDRQLLTLAASAIGSGYCRSCGRCDGACPKGLPVADILRYGMYAEGYGQFALGRQKFSLLPAAVRRVRCGDCSSCGVECAFGIPVRERLARVQDCFEPLGGAPRPAVL